MQTEINVLPTINNSDIVCFDLEMYNQDKDKLHIPHGTFAGLAIVTDHEKIWIDRVDMLPELFDRLYQCKAWVLQNALYDLIQLGAFVNIQPHPVHDVMLIEQNMWSGYYSEFNLKAMARRYFNEIIQKDKYESLSNKSINNDDLIVYAIHDAETTLRIYNHQMSIIPEQTWKVYTTIDASVLWAILDMKRPTIDVQAWMDNATIMEQKGKSIEEEIGMNTKSHPQITKWLSETFGETFTSANAEVLEKYKDHPTVAKIIEARMYRTAVGFFGKKWLENNLLPDNTVQSSWQICGAETGRMSSRKPNLQQIPARKMPQFRDYFVAKPDHKYIVADVSQQEPRILAYLSKDKNLIKAFIEKEDVHLAVTREIFHDPNIQHDDPRRKVGKAINLGTSYGLTPIGLAARLNIEIEEAENFIAAYFAKFPGVKRYIDTQRNMAFRKERVYTPFGRTIWMNIHSPQWENNAINAPIQGGGADMTKLWMSNLYDICRTYSLSYPVIMVVHDEIVLEVKADVVSAYLLLLHSAFNKAIETLFPDAPFPFEFEYEVGDRWSIKQ